MKRLLTLVLGLAMMFTIVACGGTPTVSNTTPSQPSATNNEPSTTPQAEQSNTPSTTAENSGGLSKEAQELLDSVNVSNAEASGVCGPDATWYYRNNVLVIKGTGKMTDIAGSDGWTESNRDEMEDVIPYYYLMEKIHWVVVGNGITSIGDFAFPYFSVLSRVYLPDSVQTIGGFAFAGCEN